MKLAGDIFCEGLILAETKYGVHL